MKSVLLSASLFLAISSFAQVSSDTYRQSEVSTQAAIKDGTTLESRSGKATILMTQSNGDVKLIFDLSTLNTNDVVTDSILDSRSIEPLTFSGNLGMSLFNLNEAKNDGKTYTMNGKLSFAGKDTLITAIYDPIAFSGGGYDGNASDLRINFKFNIDPSQFYIPGFTEKGFTALTIEVAPGLLNNK